MDSFWLFARRMLRYKGTLAAALAFALVSAGGLGVGIAALLPILEALLRRHDSLERILRSWSEATPFLTIPEPWLQRIPDEPFPAVVVVMAGLGVLTLVGGLAQFLHQYLALTVVHRTVTNIRREAFRTVIKLPLKTVVAAGANKNDRQPSKRDVVAAAAIPSGGGLSGGASDMVSRIVNDSNALMAGLGALTSRAVTHVTKGIAAFAVGLVLAIGIDWKLTLGVFPVTAILIIVIRKLGKRIRRASRGALQSQAGLYGAAIEAIQGMRVVKVHTTERYEAGRFHRLNKDVLKEMFRVRTARAISSPLMEVLSLFLLGGMVLVVTKRITDQQLDPAQFLLAMGALFMAGTTLKPLTGLVNDIQGSAAAADRLRELLDMEPEPGHGADLPKLPRHAESIVFENVTFTYPGAESPALTGVELRVAHGETVAVVGPNGSGKTTLLALVPRLFEPDSGRILIDGRDITEVSVRSLRRQIGVVTQETVIFKGSIRFNIAYGAEGVTEDRVTDAARRARAHEFIVEKPQGYETVVGEQGQSLSGGQRQRVAIARAILRDPAILILDEATSMIDADSEAKIAEAVGEFARGRTCLIVAHRLSTVRNADRIVVIDKGRIVDQGTHEALLGRCTVYQMLARHQLLGRMPEDREG
jgi:subfamily B ATP-binding cassette protein MsbA